MGLNYLARLRCAAKRRQDVRDVRSLQASDRPLPEGNRRPAGCTLPLRTLVGSNDARTRTPAVLSSFCSVLPERSFVDAGEGFDEHAGVLLWKMANWLSLARPHNAGI